MFKIFRQTAYLIGVGIALYFIHKLLLLPKVPTVSNDFLNFSYGYNLAATLFFLFWYYVMGLKSKDYLGFMFMVFGIVRPGIFVWLAHQKAYELNRSTLIHFFLPYLVGLGIEIYFLFKFLNQPKPKEINNL